MTRHLRTEDLGTILSVWAHPDDETYLAGGLMAAAVDARQRVVCASATAGEHGTDDPTTWPPDRLARVRRWEAAAAMAVLGVADHRWLGFEDGTLAAVDPRRGVDRVAALIAEVQPDTVVTFGPDGATFHPDHVTVSRWVTDAWRATGTPARLLHVTATVDHYRRWGPLYEEWGVYMTDERPAGHHPDELAVVVDLAGPALDRKVAALQAMATQVGPAVALLGEERFADSNRQECFVEVGRSEAGDAPAGVGAPSRSFLHPERSR
jgi:LmbE family N-acetylglucosaminyl deacetylase